MPGTRWLHSALTQVRVVITKVNGGAFARAEFVPGGRPNFPGGVDWLLNSLVVASGMPSAVIPLQFQVSISLSVSSRYA